MKIEAQGLTGVCANVTVDKITIVNSTFFALTDATGKSGPQVSIATTVADGLTEDASAWANLVKGGVI